MPNSPLIEAKIKEFDEKYEDLLKSSGLIHTYPFIKAFLTSSLLEMKEEIKREVKRLLSIMNHGLMKDTERIPIINECLDAVINLIDKK